MTTTTTYRAHAYRDESGTWCASVEALHANTDAESFLDLRANLADAVAVSIDAPVEDYAIELYVHDSDVDAAAEEMRRAS